MFKPVNTSTVLWNFFSEFDTKSQLVFISTGTQTISRKYSQTISFNNGGTQRIQINKFIHSSSCSKSIKNARKRKSFKRKLDFVSGVSWSK